jgi:hypothetical protein
MKQPDGITWYYTALALVATHNQLGALLQTWRLRQIIYMCLHLQFAAALQLNG